MPQQNRPDRMPNLAISYIARVCSFVRSPARLSVCALACLSVRLFLGGFLCCAFVRVCFRMFVCFVLARFAHVDFVSLFARLLVCAFVYRLSVGSRWPGRVYAEPAPKREWVG